MKNDVVPVQARIWANPTGHARRVPGSCRENDLGRSSRPSLARLAAAVLALLCLASGPLPAEDDQGFRSVTGPCRFAFPRDHGPHPGYRTEWWYYTGHLTGESGGRFGFQLTFFRRRLQPPDAQRDWPEPASAWRTHQIYLAHAALTDIGGRRHVMAEKISREGLGLAGAVQDGERHRIFLHDWEAAIAPQGHILRMAAPAFAFELTLTPTKGPIAHGDQGYSRKGDRPEQASCYYSFPRLAVRGQVRLDQRREVVRGTAWMDHEFSTAPLAEGVVGWDWFSIQLGNGVDLMLFRLRQADGALHPASSGTLIGADGATRHLPRDAIRTRATRRWTSSRSGATYPVAWEIVLPGEELTLAVEATVNAQEMITSGSTGVTYWEGSLAVKGRAGGRPVTGQGYMELTGYADPYAPPL